MNEARSIPLATVLLSALWATGVLMLSICGLLVATGHADAGIVVGFYALAIVAVACVLTIRSYVNRCTRLIRGLHGLNGARVSSSVEFGELRPLP